MRVSDNGRGLLQRSFSTDHMGLRNMRERAEAMGARFSIESRVGEGTTVQVLWRGTP